MPTVVLTKDERRALERYARERNVTLEEAVKILIREKSIQPDEPQKGGDNAAA